MLVTGRGANDISDAVERAIRDGELSPGEQLPTVRALADDLSVSPTTVAAAYRQLRQRGIISTHGRGGTRVHQRPPLGLTVEERLPESVIDLRMGSPDLSVLPDRTSALAAFSERREDRPNLTALLGAELEEDGVGVSHLAIAPTGAAALSQVVSSNLRPGDRVAIEDPTDSDLRDLLLSEGLQIVPVPLDTRGVIPSHLSRTLTAAVGALIISPRAQDPTATAFDEERREELASVLDAHPGLLVIERDSLGPVAGVNYRTLSQNRDRWAVVRSWGGALGRDLDITAVAGDATTVARTRGRQVLTGTGAPALVQQLCAEMLAAESTQRAFRIASRTYGARRFTMLAELRNRGIAAQALSGMHVWVPVDREQPVVRPLVERGWAVAAGDRFRIDSRPGIRVSISQLSTDAARRFADDLLEVLAA